MAAVVALQEPRGCAPRAVALPQPRGRAAVPRGASPCRSIPQLALQLLPTTVQQKQAPLDFQDHVNQQHPQLYTECQGRQLWSCLLSHLISALSYLLCLSGERDNKGRLKECQPAEGRAEAKESESTEIALTGRKRTMCSMLMYCLEQEIKISDW